MSRWYDTGVIVSIITDPVAVRVRTGVRTLILSGEIDTASLPGVLTAFGVPGGAA